MALLLPLLALLAAQLPWSAEALADATQREQNQQLAHDDATGQGETGARELANSVASLTCAAGFAEPTRQRTGQYWSQGGYCGEASVRSAAAAFGIHAPDTATRKRLKLSLFKSSGQVLVQDGVQGPEGKRVHDALRLYGLTATPRVLAGAAAFKALALKELRANRPLIFTVYISDPSSKDPYYDHIVIAQGLSGSGANQALVFDDHYSDQWNCRPFSSFSQSRLACTKILSGSGMDCADEWYTPSPKGACFCAVPKNAVVTVGQALAANQVRAELDVFTDLYRTKRYWRQAPGKSSGAAKEWNLDVKTFNNALAAPKAWYGTLRIAGVASGTILQVRRWDLLWNSSQTVRDATSKPPTHVYNFTAATANPSFMDGTPFAPTTIVVYKVFRVV